MCLRDIISSMFKGKEKAAQTPMLETIDGLEDYKEPLSTLTITYKFCKVASLLGKEFVQLFAEELHVPVEQVEKDLHTLTDDMNTDISCCVEYPYVDSFYRDTYYSFYSRKHNDYNRYCFRVSFFQGNVDEVNFYDKETAKNYRGFVVFRPTPRRIIGYSFLSPLIYPQHNYSICLCSNFISVKGKRLDVTGYPYCSHDGEMTSCAENAVVVMFDYFSRRYQNYSRVLPSHVTSTLSDSYRMRQQPSVGADEESVSVVLTSLGMASRSYYLADDESNINEEDDIYDKERFFDLLRIYVESGFPVYAATKEHAFLIIGRSDEIFSNAIKYVVMDGCCRPYSFCALNDEIRSFIVPVSENILLDAENIDNENVLQLASEMFPLIVFKDKQKTYTKRSFLTTSRSYKRYILESNLNVSIRDEILCTAMPRFIWVTEMYDKNTLHASPTKCPIDLIIILDATDYPNRWNHLLMIKTKDRIILPRLDNSRLRRRMLKTFENTDNFYPFLNNLKGTHSSWQG